MGRSSVVERGVGVGNDGKGEIEGPFSAVDRRERDRSRDGSGRRRVRPTSVFLSGGRESSVVGGSVILRFVVRDRSRKRTRFDARSVLNGR